MDLVVHPTALGPYVLVQIRDSKRPDDKIIVMPETAEEVSPYGHVLSVGPACASGIAVGDRVLFPPSNITLGYDEGQKLVFIHESCIVGKLPVMN